jgi:hypothetical protein
VAVVPELEPSSSDQNPSSRLEQFI